MPTLGCHNARLILLAIYAHGGQMGQSTARRPKIMVSGDGTGIVSQAGGLLLAQGCGPQAWMQYGNGSHSQGHSG